MLINSARKTTCHGLKCQRTIQDVKIYILPLSTERGRRLKPLLDF
jgi:hypothetical protein